VTGDPRVQDLLVELLETGATPEEVCRPCPELLPAVRAGWRRVAGVMGQVDRIFPPDDSAPTCAGSAPEVTPLPELPGYAVESVLGRGGMAVVYRARHLRLNRSVALKMLLTGPFARPEERERFRLEAEAVAGLRHPNIVQVYDSGELDGRSYFTMEFVEGGTLAQKLAGTPLAAREAGALVATLSDAVQMAHSAGILHRDLKPANVLLTADGTPKVADFGLAWRIEGDSGLTRTGVGMGTPSYMSPCQVRGDKSALGPGTDVWALGAILYECLTGRPPFKAETSAATIQQVLADDPVPPAQLNHQVPRDLETICLKCLEKDIHRRYPSAAALAADLRRFGRGEPITARPAGRLERTAKWVRRRPTKAALLAAGLLGLAGVTAAAMWYVGDRAELRAEAQSRGREVNREANAALGLAETDLTNLRRRLDDPSAVRELLSDIDQWQRLVKQAREHHERALTARAGNEALLTEATRNRLEAVEVALAREEAAYELAKELDDIAVESFASYDVRRSQQRKAVAEYERFFARQGVDIREPDTVRLASAIRSSPVRFALIAALDNWAFLAEFTKDPQLARLLELTRTADPDPWRTRFRDPAVWADREALTRLAKEEDVGRQSPTVLVSLGRLLRLNGVDPTTLYERALLDHPRDFWLHLHATMFADEPGPTVGLAHAALAIRPQSAVAYTYLAVYLRERGDLSGAVIAANRALAINPNFAIAHNFLGLALRDKRDLAGAVAALQTAAALDPDYGFACWNLGDVLRLQGNGAAAADAYRKAADRDVAGYRDLGDLRSAAAACRRLGGCLRDLNDLPGAVAAFRRAIDLDPRDFRARHGLGQLLQEQGRHAEAEQILRPIQAQPTSVPEYDSLARFLATCPDDKARDGKRAVEYATWACEQAGWKDPMYLDTLAAAYAETGQLEEAVRYQTRALDDPALTYYRRKAVRERLESYWQKKPFREQWP
jgi:serine/threonine-protein kinase